MKQYNNRTTEQQLARANDILAVYRAVAVTCGLISIIWWIVS